MSWQLTTRNLLKLFQRINASDLPFEAEFHISGIIGLKILSKFRPFRCLLVRRLERNVLYSSARVSQLISSSFQRVPLYVVHYRKPK
jgi:hypothetical protein